MGCIFRRKWKFHTPNDTVVQSSTNAFALSCEEKQYVDGTFQGVFVDGKKHGPGQMVYTNGVHFHGKWKDDMRHGLGILTYSSAPCGLTELEKAKIIQ